MRVGGAPGVTCNADFQFPMPLGWEPKSVGIRLRFQVSQECHSFLSAARETKSGDFGLRDLRILEKSLCKVLRFLEIDLRFWRSESETEIGVFR